MKNIEVKILNPQAIKDAEEMMVFCARLTQRGHNIHDMDSLMELKNSPYRDETLKAMANLPHPTIQKFGLINVAVVGASRRFLAQITRHQNEVKFMSASLQYSDYSGQAEYCVPIDVIRQGPKAIERYNKVCSAAMDEYKFFVEQGVSNDAAGYMAPQGLKNILIISATPYQWKHMISQRICRRNTEETRYVMLKIWKELFDQSFMFHNMGAFCMTGPCKEGKMACKNPLNQFKSPEEILKHDFKEVYQ